ncbi:PASTA domain-containing protein [Mangrovicoccus sp. HB161399]|uniref:PASTA domain-containing protein n=1 Tax=Mangrovicoccus sp. HB161399 TaxID=2720392 RepID=UPI0015541FC8|nr:PASTA domain-containing protein [Mangrovicoccus sp. HB161399]
MADIKSLVSDVVAAPLGEVIASVGQGVADAQNALDEGSLAAVLDIYAESDDAKLKLLQEIGYRPTFYALPETTGEVRVSLRLGQGAAGQGTGTAMRKAVPVIQAVPLRTGLNARIGSRLYATPVDAGYANRFGYAADVSAKLTFKIVPVPAPDGADELRLVPDLAGRTAAAARTAVEALGLVPVFAGEGGAVLASVPEGATAGIQEPAAHAILRLGDEVRITLLSS